MVNKKKFFSDFASLMLVLIVGSLIVGAIEGINIGRNVKEYRNTDEEIAPGDYLIFNFEINEGARINIYSYADNVSSFDDEDVIFSVMREPYFVNWVQAGNPEPDMLNSTFYFDDSYINIDNLQVPYDGTYYFVVYNPNPYDVEVYVSVSIIPWGHIIATVIMAILLLFGSSGLIVRFVHFATSKAKQEKISSSINEEEAQVTDQTKTTGKDGVFCQSCGSPLTVKDNRYCPQCGASV